MFQVSLKNVCIAFLPLIICLISWKMSEDSSKDESNWKGASSVYDFTVKDIKGDDVSLRDYAGQLLLIVNVASMCGLTSSNYKELTALDEKYREKGLRILAFPCNQFGGQEPGSPEEICSFRDKKKAEFTFFEKTEVNGDGASPLWKYLKSKQGGLLGSGIKWNFTKFLIDRNGQPVERFGPMDSFSKIEEKINKFL
nr:peroxidase 2 [Geocoris pallidipennis]